MSIKTDKPEEISASRTKTIVFFVSILIFAIAVVITLLSAKPEDIVPYSSETVKCCLMTMVENGETHLILNVSDAPDNVSDRVITAAEELSMDNGLFSYCVLNVTSNVDRSLNYSRIILDVTYKETEIPFDKAITANDDVEFVDAIISNLTQGNDYALIYCPNGRYDEDDVFNLADTADLNSNQPCSSDSIEYKIYPADNAETQLIMVKYISTIDTQTRTQLKSDIDNAIESLAKQMESDPLYNSADEYEKHRIIHDTVLTSAYYDYELIDALTNKDLSDKQKIEKSAYGILIEGKSVCSGYAYAYKALCDRMGLPCWVLSCKYGSVNHVINAVSINEETYYVDCTFDDTGDDIYEHFLFSKNDEQYQNYWFHPETVIPWEYEH